MKKLLLPAVVLSAALICGCSTAAASAQEYYSIGMAYFELGKYEEAEKWLNRARQSDRTMTASQYNLGRLAFERGRYFEAADLFEDILKRDPDNVIALRASAYTRIKTGDIDIAEKHYERLLNLIPESTDDGYNHALVLYAMERYTEAEQLLEKYMFSLRDNKDMLLLYARCQSAQNKVEAIDSFANWLNDNTDPRVRYEYAMTLEHHELYARAMEEYRLAMSEITSSTADIKRSDIRFALARVLLIADRESGEGITEMRNAINEGFDDIDAIEELLNGGKVSGENAVSLRSIIENMRRTADEQEKERDEPEDSSETDDDKGF